MVNVKELKRLFGLETLPKYAAVSYDHDFLKEEECIRLVISRVKLDEAGIQLDNNKYIINVDEKLKNYRISSLGEVGLFKKIYSGYDLSKFFEQTLADIITKYIVDLIKENITSIVLEGPIFPELARRLGRLHLDNSISIFSLTFDSRLIPLKKHDIFVDLINISKELKLNNGINNLQIYKINEVEFNKILKDWVIFEFDKDKKEVKEIRYTLNALCQFQKNDSVIIKKIKEVFIPSGLVCTREGDVWLPFALAVAHQDSTKEKLTLEDLRRIKNNSEIMYYFEEDIESDVGRPFSAEEIVLIRTKIRLLESKEDKLPSNEIGRIREEIKKIAEEQQIKVEATLESKNWAKVISQIPSQMRKKKLWRVFVGGNH